MSDEQAKRLQEPVTKGELLRILDPLEDALFKLTLSVIDVAGVQMVHAEDVEARKSGKEAFDNVGKALDNLKRYMSVRSELLASEVPRVEE